MPVALGKGLDEVDRSVPAPGRLALTSVRAATALPTGGTVATTTAFPIPLGCTRLSSRFSATRAHAGGKVKALPVWTFDTVTAPDTALDTPADGALPLIENPVSITPGASATARVVVLEVPPGATSLQWQLWEIGTDFAQPSSVGVHLAGGS